MSGIDISKFGLETNRKTDREGRPIIDLPVVSMQILLDQECEVSDWVKDVDTKHGPGRLALQVTCYGKRSKVITNSISFKMGTQAMERLHVTRYLTTPIDRGGQKYEMTHVRVLEIDHRPVSETLDGFVFSDSGEQWTFADWVERCNRQDVTN